VVKPSIFQEKHPILQEDGNYVKHSFHKLYLFQFHSTQQIAICQTNKSVTKISDHVFTFTSFLLSSTAIIVIGSSCAFRAKKVVSSVNRIILKKIFNA